MRRSSLIHHRIRAAYRRVDGTPFATEFRLGLYLDERSLAAGSMTWLYAVHDSSARAIKIGIAKDVATRVSTLQTGNPNGLALLGACPASIGLERRFHEALRPWAVRGEWFAESDEVLYLVDLIRAGEDLARDIAGFAEDDGEEPDHSAGMTIAHLTTDFAAVYERAS